MIPASRASALRVDTAANLKAILTEVCVLLDRPDADTGWSSYSISDARSTLQQHLQRIEAGDLSRVWDIYVLFAPTGLVMETSMASGWSERYVELSDRLEGVVGAMQPPMKRPSG